MIARLDRRNTCAHFAHNARTFMAENGRELAFGIKAGKRVGIGVANAGRHDFDQHFASAWTADFNGFDGERLFCLPGNGCA